jgi:protein kinase/serine/threonine-protein kinase
MSPPAPSFLDELKTRNIQKTMAIYLSTALTTIGIVRLFMEVYALPEWLFRVIVVFLTCGSVSAFIVAWYHGQEGGQKVGGREISLHAMVLIVAIVVSIRLLGSPRGLPQPFADKSIAVLPFKNLSENKEDEYFCDGITEDILTHLSRIGDLSVISRTSTMKYRNSTLSVREIADELGVAALLEGSIRRSGDRLRIVGQLIDARRDVHLWADTYDRDFKDIFEIQSEVAQKIAGALKAQLLPREKELIERKATGSLEAYAYYLQGRELYNRYTLEENERAIELFKKAVALDDQFALAYAGLADGYAQRVQRFGYEAAWAESSVAVSRHALSLDPNSAEACKALGLAYAQQGHYHHALEWYDRAIDLNPNFASVLHNAGLINSWLGRQDVAFPLVWKSILLTPGRASYYQTLGTVYREVALDSLSEQAYLKSIELQPSVPYAYGGLSQLYICQGRIADARAIIARILPMDSTDAFTFIAAGDVELFAGDLSKAAMYYRKATPLTSAESAPSTQLGYCLLMMGRKDSAAMLFQRGIDVSLAAIGASHEATEYFYDLARIHALQENIPEALKRFDEAVENGWMMRRWSVADPLLAKVRNVDGFRRALERLQGKINEQQARCLRLTS